MAKKKVSKKSGKAAKDEGKDAGRSPDGAAGGSEAEEQKSPRKDKKPRGEKKGRRQLGKQTVVFFMGHLIAAGHVGAKIPEKSSEMGRIAQRIRQMAEKLARQTLRHGEGDIALGGEEEGDDGEE